jgi:hypothetical protein
MSSKRSSRRTVGNPRTRFENNSKIKKPDRIGEGILVNVNVKTSNGLLREQGTEKAGIDKKDLIEAIIIVLVKVIKLVTV